MDKFTICFEPDGENEFERKITCTWEFPCDPNLSVIHRMCKRFAKLMGYTDETINDIFGEDIFY